MKRNVRFWTRFTGENAGGEMLLVAVLVFITTLGADQMQLEMLASLVPYFLCISAILCIIMINLSCHTLYIPLLLSMGETRRNIFFGFHYYRALIIAVTLAICAIVWALVPCEVSSIGLHSIPTLLTVLVAASAIGSIMGTLFTKWKWVAMILIIVICGGMGGCFGFLFAGGAEKLFTADIAKLVRLFLTLPWWLVLAAVGLFLLDIVFQWLLLRRQEVKL